MSVVLLVALVVALGVGSCVGALLSAGSAPGSRGSRILLGIGIVVGLYLSCGLVYSSETLRWYGAPLPVAAFERVPEGDWGGFPGPLGLLAAAPNLLFWMGLALAPRSLPYWYKRLVVVGWSKAIGAAALIGVVGALAVHAAPVVEDAIVPSHMVVLRNQTSQTLSGVGVQCDRSIQYRSRMLPSEEHAFRCDGEVSTPQVWRRRALLGQCDDAAGKHNRLVITLSGSDGEIVRCRSSMP